MARYKDYHCPLCGLKLRHIRTGMAIKIGYYHEVTCKNNHSVMMIQQMKDNHLILLTSLKEEE